jgi:hypothetical protein
MAVPGVWRVGKRVLIQLDKPFEYLFTEVKTIIGVNLTILARRLSGGVARFIMS